MYAAKPGSVLSMLPINRQRYNLPYFCLYPSFVKFLFWWLTICLCRPMIHSGRNSHRTNRPRRFAPRLRLLLWNCHGRCRFIFYTPYWQWSLSGWSGSQPCWWGNYSFFWFWSCASTKNPSSHSESKIFMPSFLCGPALSFKDAAAWSSPHNSA